MSHTLRLLICWDRNMKFSQKLVIYSSDCVNSITLLVAICTQLKTSDTHMRYTMRTSKLLTSLANQESWWRFPVKLNKKWFLSFSDHLEYNILVNNKFVEELNYWTRVLSLDGQSYRSKMGELACQPSAIRAVEAVRFNWQNPNCNKTTGQNKFAKLWYEKPNKLS